MGRKRGKMISKGLRKLSIKALSLLMVTVFSAGFLGIFSKPAEVSADGDLYSSLYGVFKDRSGEGDNFMSQETFIARMLYYCEILNEINYTYGSQESELGCDGFVSLVLRLTFCTAHKFSRVRGGKYECKFDYREEHTVASSPVDKYEVFRPGGTSATWLYKNYVNKVVKPLVTREKVTDKSNSDWIKYLNSVGAQPGDIMFWDNDKNLDYWSHVSIYAGVINGVPMMWHASSIKGQVCRQCLGEITCENSYLKYVSIMPSTDRPARVGLFVDENDVSGAFSYSVYTAPDFKECKGHITNGCSLSGQTYLSSIPVYPNDDKSSYERTLYLRRNVPPYKADSAYCSGADQIVYRLDIRITRDDEGKATLRYHICGASDVRNYISGQIDDFDLFAGGNTIPVTDFR